MRFIDTDHDVFVDSNEMELRTVTLISPAPSNANYSRESRLRLLFRDIAAFKQLQNPLSSSSPTLLSELLPREEHD